MKLHKRRQKPRIGTVSNIELLRMAAYRGANLVFNCYSGSKQGQEKCIVLVRFLPLKDQK